MRSMVSMVISGRRARSRGPRRRGRTLHDVGVLRAMADGLAAHGGHDAIGGAFDQLEAEGAADAVAHVEELLDAEVVHKPELVVCGRAPPVARPNSKAKRNFMR